MQAAFKGYILPNGSSPPDFSTSAIIGKVLLPGVQDFYHPFENYAQPPTGQYKLNNSRSTQIANGELVAWVVGKIDYVDSAGSKGWGTICTKFAPGQNRFIPAEVEDWRTDAG
jgi:hypothetical protein